MVDRGEIGASDELHNDEQVHRKQTFSTLYRTQMSLGMRGNMFEPSTFVKPDWKYESAQPLPVWLKLVREGGQKLTVESANMDFRNSVANVQSPWLAQSNGQTSIDPERTRFEVNLILI